MFKQFNMKKKWKSRFLDIFIALFGVLLGLTNGEKYMKSDVVVDFLEVGTLKNYTLNDETEFIIEIMHLPEVSYFQVTFITLTTSNNFKQLNILQFFPLNRKLKELHQEYL